MNIIFLPLLQLVLVSTGSSGNPCADCGLQGFPRSSENDERVAVRLGSRDENAIRRTVRGFLENKENTKIVEHDLTNTADHEDNYPVAASLEEAGTGQTGIMKRRVADAELDKKVSRVVETGLVPLTQDVLKRQAAGESVTDKIIRTVVPVIIKYGKMILTVIFPPSVAIFTAIDTVLAVVQKVTDVYTQVSAVINPLPILPELPPLPPKSLFMEMLFLVG